MPATATRYTSRLVSLTDWVQETYGHELYNWAVWHLGDGSQRTTLSDNVLDVATHGPVLIDPEPMATGYGGHYTVYALYQREGRQHVIVGWWQCDDAEDVAHVATDCPPLTAELVAGFVKDAPVDPKMTVLIADIRRYLARKQIAKW